MKFSLLILVSGLSFALAEPPKKSEAHQIGAKPVMVSPDDIKFAPAAPASGLPSGVEMTVLSGDPSKAGLFSVRIKIPDGVKVAPHWHPTDEHVTVLQGTFAAGMGDKFEDSALREFPTGAYILLPKKMHHFATAKGDTILQIHAMGPFALIYVNPADDPRKK